LSRRPAPADLRHVGMARFATEMPVAVRSAAGRGRDRRRSNTVLPRRGRSAQRKEMEL
jgi:hypothetical protein